MSILGIGWPWHAVLVVGVAVRLDVWLWWLAEGRHRRGRR